MTKTKTLAHPIETSLSLTIALILAAAPFMTQAEVGVNSEATGSLEATVNLNATGSDSMLGVDVDIDTATETATTTFPEASTSTDDEGALSLRLNAEGIAITSANDVNTEADLEVFAYNVAAEREMIDETNAEVTEEGKSRIYVTYKHQGELFGVMPVVIKSTTIVTTGDGEVEVDSDLPWWGFLATKKNYAAAEIESRIKDNPTVMMSAEMEATAAVQAEVIEAVVAELEAHSSLHAALNG